MNRSASRWSAGVWGLVRMGLRSRRDRAFSPSPERVGRGVCLRGSATGDPLAQRTSDGTGRNPTVVSFCSSASTSDVGQAGLAVSIDGHVLLRSRTSGGSLDESR